MEKILIIESDIDQIYFFSEYLVKQPLEIYVATSYKEAISKIDSVKPEIILFDHDLVDINLTQLVRYIERVKIYPYLLVISNNKIGDDAPDYPDINFLKKPVIKYSLLGFINDYLARKKFKANTPETVLSRSFINEVVNKGNFVIVDYRHNIRHVLNLMQNKAVKNAVVLNEVNKIHSVISEADIFSYLYDQSHDHQNISLVSIARVCKQKQSSS